VNSVSVSAWPAVKLLWGDADTVDVRARSVTASPVQTAKLLWEARGASNLNVTAESAKEGPLRLTDVSLRKRGSALSAQGQVSQADVVAALPPGISVSLVKSEGGQVEVQASGGLFGIQASLDAVAVAREGRLVAHPLGFLLEGLQLQLFADPHVHVNGVGASAISPSTGAGGYTLTMTATLH
jgi:hypothetical protein